MGRHGNYCKGVFIFTLIKINSMEKSKILIYIIFGVFLAIFYQDNADSQTEARFYNLLETHRYSNNYSKSVFDCSQMSVLLESFLEYEGYPSYIVVTDQPNEPIEHCYVLSLVDNKWLAIEPTTDPLNKLGRVRSYTLKNTRLFENLSDAMEYDKVDPIKEWVTEEYILKK